MDNPALSELITGTRLLLDVLEEEMDPQHPVARYVRETLERMHRRIVPPDEDGGDYRLLHPYELFRIDHGLA
jgi:hypothetical protein